MIGPIYNDEPSSEDKLGHHALARAFADLAASCETPFVIGIFGPWGSGKTTFLHLIEKEFDPKTSHFVWFNAWEHDLDEAPAISLLHAAVESLRLGDEFREALAKVALAFGSVLLRKTTSLSIADLEKVQNLLDTEAFRVREARVKLKQHFQKVLARASGGPDGRVIFFIDDLDRCSPQVVLRMLSAIKLYFNVPGCVFFLALDRETIESAIATGSEAVSASGEARYLDKMIQLPFFLPPIAKETFEDFAAGLLPRHLHDCLPIVTVGLEPNPRTLKRFVNNLLLRHALAKLLRIANYDVRLLALLLLIEHHQPALFRKLGQDPERLRELHKDPSKAAGEISSPRLLQALSMSYVPRFASMKMYFSLTNLDLGLTEEATRDLDWRVVLTDHRVWLKSFRLQGSRADLKGANLAEANLSGALLREAILATAVMNDANLRNADLRRAELAGAVLRRANLDAALLCHADLCEADLEDADLRRADLHNADLTRANLRGTDLRHTMGLTESQLKESLIDERTRLPVQLMVPFRDDLRRK